MMAKAFWDIDLGRALEGPSRRGARRMADVRATLHPDAPAALELSIARTRVLDYL